MRAYAVNRTYRNLTMPNTTTTCFRSSSKIAEPIQELITKDCPVINRKTATTTLTKFNKKNNVKTTWERIKKYTRSLFGTK